jgi:uncharacterized repeat protein (TIGR03803 family)
MRRSFSSLCLASIACALILQHPGTAIAASDERVLHSFGGPPGDGTEPLAGLIDVNGTLYGTTIYGGANDDGMVFSVDQTTGAETVVYSFCSEQNCKDGWEPLASLVDVSGMLYGTTHSGGADLSKKCTYVDIDSCGTVFSIDPTTDTESVLHSFTSYRSDGSQPNAGLIDLKGTLYGTTLSGGSYTKNCGVGPNGYPLGCGTVFALDPKTGADRVLHSFPNNRMDGNGPVAGLIEVDGVLYGTTLTGGRNQGCSPIEGNGCGAVFSVDPKTGAETVLYSFCSQKKCADGEWPYASLVDVNGTLYGTTWTGGANSNSELCGGGDGVVGCGTVFSLDPTTGDETVIYSFCSQKKCTDGADPKANLINVNGMLYGTTGSGGIHGGGTVFSLDPGTGKETVVYSFCSKQNCADGWFPSAALTNVNGTLYGTTAGGGAFEVGTVFAVTP